jgi:hypothetical protein
MSDKKPEYISLYDGRVGFWGRWLVSYGTLLAMIGVGRWIESDALQWVAAIVWFVGLMGFAANYAKQNLKTPQAAAQYLAQHYGVIATRPTPSTEGTT